MYNRYIPQADGSFRKNQMPDPTQARRPPSPPPPPRQEQAEMHSCQQQEPHHDIHRQSIGAGDFLRRLLPKDLDTGDLLTIVLLLLMAGDCAEDKNTALLTLALYLIL